MTVGENVPMDDEDRAFLRTLIPDGSVDLGFLAIAAWMDGDGELHWKCYTQLDMVLSGQLGLLEMAKLELVRRTIPALFDRDD